jgi:hypothetical protein
LPAGTALNGVEEADELLVAVALCASAAHRALEDINGGERGGGAVALVVNRQTDWPTIKNCRKPDRVLRSGRKPVRGVKSQPSMLPFQLPV